MKRIILHAVAALACCLTLELRGQSIPFTYQGRVADMNGPLNGPVPMDFRLYAAASGGIAVWQEAHASIPVSNGLFSVTLGQTTPVDVMIFDGSARWLGISVNGSAELTPRTLVTATPYAIHAANAASLMTVGSAPLDIKVNGKRALRLEPTTSNDTVNVIGGSPLNVVGEGVIGATIAGGGSRNFFGVPQPNQVLANLGAIGGGSANTIAAGATHSVIAGGTRNEVGLNAAESVISGGHNNRITAHAQRSVIAGGVLNEIGTNSTQDTIGGGLENKIGWDAHYSTIGGGRRNDIHGRSWDSTIVGGYGNHIGLASGGSLIGGSDNAISSNSVLATIAGGGLNRSGATSPGTTISGGYDNDIANGSSYSTIAGGELNEIGANSSHSVVGGGHFNHIVTNSSYSVIGGGQDNRISANSSHSVIDGGVLNRISTNSVNATIGGGALNNIRGLAAFSTIGGGTNNSVEFASSAAIVAGGQGNHIGTNAAYSTIGGGFGNGISANAQFATIPGGVNNLATNRAFAAGSRARANHVGAFVWADNATTSELASTNANSVTMRAVGGYRLISGIAPLVTGVFLAPGDGSWTSLSDRNAKEHLEPVDARAVLDKVAALPLSTWNYKNQTNGVRHIGPMAQDFKAAFAVGAAETGITTVDADGVALAAIQGLNQKLETKIATLERRLAELEELLLKSTATEK